MLYLRFIKVQTGCRLLILQQKLKMGYTKPSTGPPGCMWTIGLRLDTAVLDELT